MKPRVLLVEDDNSIGVTLSQKLYGEGYDTVLCTTATQAQNHLETQKWSLCIFDLNLPDGSGFKLAEYVTKNLVDVPIILITALNTAENRLTGLELGVHEFIPKPFLFKELLLRLKRLLKQKSAEVVQYKINGGILDLDRMCFISENSQTSFFTSRDFHVLKLLIEKNTQPVSREEILEIVVGTDQFPTQRTVDNSITRLRQILGDRDGVIIRSIRGVGYQWVHPGTDADAAKSDATKRSQS